jgi:hypothetical protein
VTTSADLSSALKTVLLTVPNIGTVHDRPRWVATWDGFLNLFRATIGGRNLIRGWYIQRDGAQPAFASEFGAQERAHNYLITGIAGLADSDELSQYAAMQSLADTIMATLEAQADLGVAGVVEDGIGPCALESYDEQQFGSVLCHVLVLSVPIRVSRALGVA